MRIYLWLAVGEGQPTIVVACPDPNRMEAAIRHRFEGLFGFWPAAACCAAHARDTAERYLLGLGYTQIITTATELAAAPEAP